MEVEKLKKRLDVYLEVGRYAAAERLLMNFIEASDDPPPEIVNSLGLVYHMQGKFVEAMKQFERALALNPKFVEASLNLSATLADVCCYDQAAEVFVTYTKEAYEEPDADIFKQHLKIAESYEKKGLTKKAIEQLLAVKPPPSNRTALSLALARLYLKDNCPSQAQIILKQCVDQDQDNVQVLVWSGVAAFRSGKHQEARTFWLKAKKVNPDLSLPRAYADLPAF